MTWGELGHALVWTWRHAAKRYNIAEVEWLRWYIAETDTCLDVGAHAGSWTIPLSQLAKRGHVYAFEALPHYANALRLTLTILQRRRVTVVNVAVGDHCGTIPIVYKDSLGRRLTGYTHIARLGEPTEETVQVQGATLDSFCQTVPQVRIRFVKCDVEGAELLVLRGAVNMIEMMRPIFYCESNRELYQQYGYTVEDVFEFLDKRDYRAHVVSPTGRFFPAYPLSVPDNGDLLFLPAEVSVRVG